MGTTTAKVGMKRYNLALPEGLFNEVQAVANQRGVSVVDVLRQFIKLGLKVVEIEAKPDACLVYRQGGEETRLVLL